MSTTKKPMRLVTITIVPTWLTSHRGQLGTPAIEQVHRRVTDRLAKANVYRAAGVLEVRLVEDQGDRYPSAWAWHVHGLALTRDPDALAKRLAKVFPRTDVVPCPVRLTPWDGGPKWLRYCYKLDSSCRVGVDDARLDVRKQQLRKGRGTTSRSLMPTKKLELLLFHDRIGLDSRILTKGAQLRSTSDGCRIVKLQRTKR
jgi:hypothetical protein